MSLTITVRKATETTGGEQKALPADGDNGNQEIDTQKEAEAALAYVTSDDLVAIVGGKTYSRKDLTDIRDKNASASARAGASATVATPASDEKERGTGVSHGFGIEGGGTFTRGDKAHGDVRLRADYLLGVPVTKNGKITPTLGLGIASASRDESTPGGNAFTSGFKSLEIQLGALYQYHMPFFDRLFVAGGIMGKMGPIWTASADKVNLPGSCTPISPKNPSDGNFGRAECEPNAGPRQADSGTTSGTLMNYDRGSARETSGLMLGLQIPLRIGIDILRGSWGSMDLRVGPDLNVIKLMPRDGHGFSYVTPGVHGGVVARFGGVDAYVSQGVTTRPDQDGDGIPDGDDKCANTPARTKVDATGCAIDRDNDGIENDKDACPDSAGVANADPKLNGCPAPVAPAAAPIEASVLSVPASVKPNQDFPLSIEVKSKNKLEVSVAFVDKDGKPTNSSKSHLVRSGRGDFPFDVPSSLKAGKYKLVVTFEDPKTGVEKVEEKEIVVVESVTATLPGSFAPGQPPAVQNAKVAGIDKLEGVTYSVEGFDKDNKSVGTASGKNPVTLNEKTGQLIKLDAPGNKGFQKDITYKVTLKNKDGFDVWSGSFVVGQAAVGGKKVKPK